MNFHGIKYFSLWYLTLVFSGAFFGTIAAVSASFVQSTNAAIETLRKRDCAITVIGANGSPTPGAAIAVNQVRHHFGFGAAIPYRILNDTNLQKVFLDHFDWAVFENDLKWPMTDTSADGPDYTKPDNLLDWCLKNDIKVRAHCLFWNQDAEKIPAWTRNLSTTAFQEAVDARITNAITHYKGKVEQWDVANEVIHGTVLESKTGNSDIWNYIFNKVKGIDGTVKKAINDFNIVEQYSDVDKYVTKIKTISNIDIIGVEGHFGSYLVQNDYKTKLEKVAAVGKPIWFTEVDFSVAMNVRCDRFEELLRTAFAHSKVEGFTMWVFWQGNRWRSDLTSYIADSATYAINDLGQRYESLLKQWTTSSSGTTDGSGKYSFNGFQGKYLVTTTTDGRNQIDTIYLEPGQGVKTVSITIRESGIASGYSAVSTSRTIRINDKLVKINNVTAGKEPLFVSIYSTSGRLISRQQIDRNRNGENIFLKTPAGCYCISIGTLTDRFSTVGIFLPRR
jgi:endo-1,4-beta-xylanase